jgi:Tol biopolymer transport system component
LNLWKVAASGVWPIQLSESDDRQFGGVWSPDRSALAITARSNTSSNFEIESLDWKTRRVRKLTNERTKDRE